LLTSRFNLNTLYQKHFNVVIYDLVIYTHHI